MAARWLRLRNERNATNNGTYINLDNGARLGVREYSHYGTKWEVWLKQNAFPAETLADGYASAEEALSALDEFMSEEDVKQLQPPVTPEEVTDTDDEEDE